MVVVLDGPARGRCVMDSGEKRWHNDNEWTRRPQVEVAIAADTNAVVNQVMDWLTRTKPCPTTAAQALGPRGKSSCPLLSPLGGATHDSTPDLTKLGLGVSPVNSPGSRSSNAGKNLKSHV